MSQEKKQETKPSVAEFHGERSKKLLKCSVEATAHQKEYFKQVKDRMSQGEPVLWTYTGTPWIIFRSMDLLMMDSVNYSAVCSAKQMSQYYLDKLNVEGYFRDLCRYCTVPLGYALDKKPEIAPWGGLPKFAAAIGYHQDDPAMKIWEIYAREFNVPLYYIDRAYMTRYPRKQNWWEDFREEDAEAEEHRLGQLIEEYEGMIRFLETTTGKHFSETELRKFLDRDNLTCEYKWKATELAANHPCPVSWTDALANVSGIYYVGTEWAVKNAKDYYEEIKERVDKGQGACDNEQVRLRWEGHPTWFSLGFFNAWEESHGAVMLPLYYFYGMETNIRRDLADPLRAVASRVMRLVELRVPTTRSQFDLYVSQKYQADGVIFMVVESCKLLYTGVLFSREAHEKAGIPTMEINADMVDARDWDDTKMKGLVTSFIETITG